MKALMIGLAAFAVSVHSHAASTLSPLAGIITDYDIAQKRFHPIAVSIDGDRDALSRLDDDGPAAQAEEVKILDGLAARLKALPPSDRLSEDSINRSYLTFVLQMRLKELSLDTARMAFDAYSGFYEISLALGEMTRIRDRADADAYLKRLSGLPRYYEIEIAHARQRAVVRGHHRRIRDDRLAWFRCAWLDCRWPRDQNF
jgi:uncharacterized protein (DUF885 family)